MKAPADGWDDEEREAIAELRDELETLQARHRDDPEIALLRAARHAALPSEVQQAADDLTTVLRVDPNNRQALLLRAKLYERLRQGQSAKNDFEQACALGSDEACAAVAHLATTPPQ